MPDERIRLHPVGRFVFNVDSIAPKGEFLICAGCRELGVCRFGMTSEDFLEDGTHRVEMQCPAIYAGAPGVAHGGWTSAVLDEMLGHLAIYRGRFTVTSTLNVRYVRPVPVDRDLIGLSRVIRQEKGRWHLRGDLMLADTEELLARADGVFVEREQGHYDKHEERFRSE